MTPALPPPALSNMKQFTAEHWDKVPREMHKSKVKHVVTKMVEGEEIWTEFAFHNGNAFMRKQSEMDMETFSHLHVNQQVFVETIQGELVTGLHVPEVGWVFRMSSQDLADYAQRTVTAVQEQRSKAKAEMTDFLSDAIVQGIGAQGVHVELHLVGTEASLLIGQTAFNPDELAEYIVKAMENAKK